MSWKGEPGPWGAHTEAELVDHLITQLAQDVDSGMPIDRDDGYNHRILVDGYALRQALGVLRRYRETLTE